MHPIEYTDDWLNFHFKSNVGKFLKSQFKELDHRVSEDLAMEPFKRALFNFFDALLYGTLPDPVIQTGFHWRSGKFYPAIFQPPSPQKNTPPWF